MNGPPEWDGFRAIQVLFRGVYLIRYRDTLPDRHVRRRDRRELLCAAGHIALDVGVRTGRQSYIATPRVPGTALRSEGDESLPLPAGASRRLAADARPRPCQRIQFSPRGTTLVRERVGPPGRTGKVLFRLNYPQQASVSAGRLTSADSRCSSSPTPR